MLKKEVKELKERVADVCNLVWKHHLVTGTGGNVSARIPNTNCVIIKPSGFHMYDVTPDSLILVDIYGKFVEKYLGLEKREITSIVGRKERKE